MAEDRAGQVERLEAQLAEEQRERVAAQERAAWAWCRVQEVEGIGQTLLTANAELIALAEQSETRVQELERELAALRSKACEDRARPLREIEQKIRALHWYGNPPDQRLQHDVDGDVDDIMADVLRLIEAPPPPKVTDAMLDAALRVIEEDPESGWGMTATHQGDLALLRRALAAAWRAASSGEA